MKSAKAGNVYRILGLDGHHWMTGKVLELIDDGTRARVELTDAITSIGRFPNLVVGDVLRIELQFVRLEAA